LESYDKCCYCQRVNENCPDKEPNFTLGTESCPFIPNFKGVKLIDVLHSELFRNWLKRFRKELDEIDKKAKVFLCGGLLKRGFTLGDIDILIVSPQTSFEAFSEFESKWIGNSFRNKKLQCKHNAQKVSELMLDVWIYDRTEFFGEITPKSKLISDLRKGLVRMRIA
jgi:predicted nucleotidyltransferase